MILPDEPLSKVVGRRIKQRREQGKIYLGHAGLDAVARVPQRGELAARNQALQAAQRVLQEHLKIARDQARYAQGPSSVFGVKGPMPVGGSKGGYVEDPGTTGLDRSMSRRSYSHNQDATRLLAELVRQRLQGKRQRRRPIFY